jgi:hypothetical protein
MHDIVKLQKPFMASARENEESQLPKRPRNLNITSSDAERVGKRPEKLKSHDDNQT